MTGTTSNIKAGDIKEIANWTGRQFGEYRGHRIIDKDIRILSHTGGFAIFLPHDFWRALDCWVNNIFLPENNNSPCWIAGKGFAYIKVDVDPSKLEE